MSVDGLSRCNSSKNESRPQLAQGSTACGDESTAERECDEEFDGTLTADMAAEGLSNLNWSADGTCQAFLHLNLPERKLNDICILQHYVHLQKVEIPFNQLTDLSALSCMSALLELDASHNCISKLLDFTPPKNLKIVKMSFNCIEEMPDLSAHHYLQHLELDYNKIQKIQGLTCCHRLAYLSMRHNAVSRIEGLSHLPIKFLCLNANQIQRIENLETLSFLRTLEIAGNKIRSLDGLQRLEHLESVDMENNEIIDMAEIVKMASLDTLRTLNLQCNPIRELPDYRLAVVHILNRLTELDAIPVAVEEKVAALNLFNPSMEYLAARDHMMHLVYSFLQPTRLLDITLPVLESPYPLLILVGPQGVGKKNLAQKLAEELPDYFGYAASHTTRLPYADEVPDKDYHFISLDEFEQGIKMGAFTQTCSINGELYGLCMDAVEAVARESLACVTHMELEGVLTLKNSYLEPRYVLLLPATRECHERHLIEKAVYTQEQVDSILQRAEMYAEYNREHPGFFDTTCMSDDITETYCWLQNLVLEYLGIPTSSAKDSSDLESTTTDLSIDRAGTGVGSGYQKELGRGRSAPLGDRRSWSPPRLADYRIVKSAGSAALQPTSSIELLSLQRRQNAIKETVLGRSPALYEQLLQRGSYIPQNVNPANEVSARWHSAPPMCAHSGKMQQKTASSHSSDSGSQVGCTAPVAHTPSVCKNNNSSNSAEHVHPIKRQQPEDTVLDLTSPLIRPASVTSSGNRPEASTKISHRNSEPAISCFSDATSGGRPGSGRHSVLPPIRSADASVMLS